MRRPWNAASCVISWRPPELNEVETLQSEALELLESTIEIRCTDLTFPIDISLHPFTPPSSTDPRNHTALVLQGSTHNPGLG